MGFLNRFKQSKSVTVAACASGAVVEMKNIDDPAFSEGILGFCCGIEPDTGEIFSPANGTITQISDTLHAVGIRTAEGCDILIHAGIDTVNMQGDGFTVFVNVGDKVAVGQPILSADLEKIRSVGYKTTVITAITNSEEYKSIRLSAAGRVSRGNPLMEIQL